MRTFWRDETIDVDIVTGAIHQAVQLLDGIGVGTGRREDQLTIVRTIIGLNLWHVRDSIGDQLLSIGIGVASQQGFAAIDGEADPGEESQFPIKGWTYRGQYVVIGQTTDATAYTRIDKDIRAMRKLENGIYYLGLRNDNLTPTAFNVRVTGLIRMLVGVPD